EARGKIELVATLSPTGIHNIITTGWNIKRNAVYKYYANGSLSSEGSGSDNSQSGQLDLDPSSDGKIYDLDGPSCGASYFYHTKEVYNNFTQWVEWNGTKCSNDALWHYRAQVDDDLDASNKPDNDDTELNDVGSGHITIPSTAHYSTRQ
ncbi:MAG: hypothetical protein KAS17_11875, partial [Victivallaceae bacterium]|nr:hypothetical protein [Victivallaceae bacterium]